MRRPSWRTVAVLVTSAVVAASCSTSTTALKHKKKHHHLHALAAPAPTSTTSTTSTTSNSGTGTTGSGGSGTDDSGTGNTGTGTGTSTTVIGGVTTTTIGADNPAIAAAGATTTTTSPYRVGRRGRIKLRRGAPLIAAFKPLSSTPGGTVIITGRRLSHATAVAFDGVPATITADSSQRIKATVPAGATTGPISVVTPAGTATVQGFTIT